MTSLCWSWTHLNITTARLKLYRSAVYFYQGRFIHTLKRPFSRPFYDLQRPNCRVFQDSKNAFSRPVNFPAGSRSPRKIWWNLRPPKSLQKCQIKYVPYCKYAVHLTVCKSHPGLDMSEPARESAGTKISRTIILEFKDFCRVFQDLRLLTGLCRPENLNISITGLSRICKNPASR